MVTVCLLAPQLLGGALPWTAVLIAILALLGAGVMALNVTLPKEGALLAVFVAVAFTCFQVLPFPPWVVSWVSPQRAVALEATYELLGSSDWLAFSLDPGGTRLALLHSVTVASGVIVGYASVERIGRHGVARVVGASVALMSAITLVHELAGSDAVFGIYVPIEAGRSAAPLMNPNHLGGFLAFGVPIQLFLARRSRDAERLGWLSAALVGAVIVPLTGSRSGMVGLGVGLLLFAIFTRKEMKAKGWRTGLLGVALVGVVTAIALDPAVLAGKLERGDYSKLSLAMTSLDLFASFPVLGVGRGAFASAFTHLSSGVVRPTHVENIAVHWLVEWGLMSLFVAIPLITLLIKGLRRRDPWVRVIAASLVAFGVHDLTDFALELPGVAFVAAVAFGSLLSQSETRFGLWTTRGVLVGFVLMVGGALVVGNVESPDQAAQRLSVSRLSQQDIENALSSHPLEPGLTLLAAHHANEVNDPIALRWINRSMVLAPEWSGPHEVAASWLARHAAFDQALLEVREAERPLPGSAVRRACEWVDLGLAPEDLSSVLPSDDSSLARSIVDRLGECLRGEALVTLARMASERQIQSVPLTVRQVYSIPVAERVAFLQDAIRQNDDLRLRVSLANTYLHQDRARDALRVLPLTVDISQIALEVRAIAAALAEDPEELSATFTALDVRFGQSETGFIRVAQAKARALEGAGRDEEAIDVLDAAAAAQPGVQLFQFIVGAAVRTGHPHRAASARTELCRRGVGDNCDR